MMTVTMLTDVVRKAVPVHVKKCQNLTQRGVEEAPLT